MHRLFHDFQAATLGDHLVQTLPQRQLNLHAFRPVRGAHSGNLGLILEKDSLRISISLLTRSGAPLTFDSLGVLKPKHGSGIEHLATDREGVEGITFAG